MKSLVEEAIHAVEAKADGVAIESIGKLYQAYCEERAARVEAEEATEVAMEQLAKQDFQVEELKDKLRTAEFQRERMYAEIDELRKEIGTGELGVFEVADFLRGFRKAGAA